MANKNPSESTRFKKGQSGNPNGRPRKIPELKEVLNQVMGEENAEGLTAMEAVIKRLRQQAIGGNLRAAELLIKYSYGMPKQSVELMDTDGKNPFSAIEVIIKKSE